ncbi:hypothetical protein GF357_02165 [Candidatus Dojkabacteria bacterium]|nr:hypothetical protein [Candidatus Dojkabacteria bacterium]
MTEKKDNDAKKIKKLIIKSEDELIDVIRKLKNSDSKHIILTFAEKSDLLISPISFKVLQKTADEEGKLIIAQIVQHKAGLTNAQFAKVTATSSPNEVPADLWKIAKQDLEFRQEDKAERLKHKDKLPEPKQDPEPTETPENMDLKEFDLAKEADCGEKPLPIKDETDIPEIEDSDEGSEEPITEDKEEPKEGPQEHVSDFQKRISETLLKAQKDYTDPQNKIVREDDFIIALDQDIKDVPGVNLDEFENESLESFERSDEDSDSNSNEQKLKSSDKKASSEKPTTVESKDPAEIESKLPSSSQNNTPTPSEKKTPKKLSRPDKDNDLKLEFYEDDIDQFDLQNDKADTKQPQKSHINSSGPDTSSHKNSAKDRIKDFIKSASDKIQQTAASVKAGSPDEKADSDLQPKPNPQLQKKSSDLVGKDLRNTPAPKPQKSMQISHKPTNYTNSALSPSQFNQMQNHAQGRRNTASPISSIISSLKTLVSSILPKGKNLNIRKLILPTVFIFLLIFYGIYKITSQATVNVSIESRPVTFERTFTGKEGAEFSLSEDRIAVKKEEVVRERSETGDASGTGYEGEPSSGTIKVQCLISVDEFPDNVITIPKGTTATEISTGKKYETLSAIDDKQCPSLTSIDIKAKGVGPDYNLESGSGVFAFDGFDRNKVSAVNVSAIDGGTQEEVPEITQEDVDDLIEDLEEIVEEEAQTELEEINAVDGWIVIQDTIDHETEGDPKPDPSVGTQSETFDIGLSVKSSALYYRKSDIENSLPEIILEEARKQNVFGNTTELQVVGEIDTRYSVDVEDNDDAEEVKVKIEVSAMVKPEITEEEILANLEGKSWNEGMDYLGDLPFLAGPVEADFKPAWFPAFLKHFPDGKNQIFVHINEVSFSSDESEDIPEESESEESQDEDQSED